MDMICLMHEGEPYGHLRTSAGDVTDSFLSRISGLTLKQVSDFLGQLKSFNVYSITESGTIYSRRMVRDEAIREARAKGGQKSVLNPNVPRSKKIPLDEGERMVKRISLEASFGGSPSSSSSSSSLNTPPTPKNGAGDGAFEFELLATAERIHDRHPKTKHDVLSVSGVASKLRTICKKLSGGSKLAKLREIDSSHESHCHSDNWLRGFHLKLENFLAPTMRRWESEVPTPSDDDVGLFSSAPPESMVLR